MHASQPHHVVIAGAGFAGLSVAHGLAGAPVRITIIDQRNHHLFQPLLYQVGTATLATSEIAWPIRHLLRRRKEVTTLLGVVEDALTRNERQSEQDVEAARYRERRASLTEREAEVFALLLEGCPSKTVAARLDITLRTAEHHRAAVMRKFEAKSLSSLLRVALASNG